MSPLGYRLNSIDSIKMPQPTRQHRSCEYYRSYFRLPLLSHQSISSETLTRSISARTPQQVQSMVRVPSSTFSDMKFLVWLCSEMGLNFVVFSPHRVRISCLSLTYRAICLRLFFLMRQNSSWNSGLCSRQFYNLLSKWPRLVYELANYMKFLASNLMNSFIKSTSRRYKFSLFSKGCLFFIHGLSLSLWSGSDTSKRAGSVFIGLYPRLVSVLLTVSMPVTWMAVVNQLQAAFIPLIYLLLLWGMGQNKQILQKSDYPLCSYCGLKLTDFLVHEPVLHLLIGIVSNPYQTRNAEEQAKCCQNVAYYHVLAGMEYVGSGMGNQHRHTQCYQQPMVDEVQY